MNPAVLHGVIVDTLQQPPVTPAGHRADLALGVVMRPLPISNLQKMLHIHRSGLVPVLGLMGEGLRALSSVKAAPLRCQSQACQTFS